MVDVFAELFGRFAGCSKGKGGSMHLYTKKGNFYGGQGIVGAQVPMGVGLAFAEKYKAGKGNPSNVSISMYGDGAANQGQIWEAANMAGLWKLPAIFLIENNQYGMGTSTQRSSSNNQYFTMGNAIPGIRVDGMDVLASREVIKFAREYCSSGKGPIYVEMKTYRYHGHSMSDPGITYRDREEVNKVRETQDCLLQLKNRILKYNLASEDDIKAIEKDVRNVVANSLKEAKSLPYPAEHETYSDIYYQEIPSFIRGREYQESLGKMV
jgi:pyruvate dehydrogenase E1 component alpha subunit